MVDKITAAEVVVYNKTTGTFEIVIANYTHHQDLLKALKGGIGGNFGRVTRWWAKVFRAPRVVDFVFEGLSSFQSQQLDRIYEGLRNYNALNMFSQKLTENYESEVPFDCLGHLESNQSFSNGIEIDQSFSNGTDVNLSSVPTGAPVNGADSSLPASMACSSSVPAILAAMTIAAMVSAAFGYVVEIRSIAIDYINFAPMYRRDGALLTSPLSIRCLIFYLIIS
jgi:hypothetical protein